MDARVAAINPHGVVTMVQIEVQSNGSNSRLFGSGDGAAVEVTLPVVADVAEARRWSATFRRIDRIEITVTARSFSAVIDGIGHRLPIKRRIPMTAALGLGELGVPMMLRDHTSWS